MRRGSKGVTELRLEPRLLPPSTILSLLGDLLFCLVGGLPCLQFCPCVELPLFPLSFWFSFHSHSLSSFQQTPGLLISLGISFFTFKMGILLLPLLSGLLSCQPCSPGLGQPGVFLDTCRKLYLRLREHLLPHLVPTFSLITHWIGSNKTLTTWMRH